MTSPKRVQNSSPESVTRVGGLLGAPSSFAGAPSNCCEKAIMPLTNFFFKKPGLSLLAFPFLLLLPNQLLLLPASSSFFVPLLLHVRALLCASSTSSLRRLPPLLIWSCEEAYTKSNAIVEEVSVHRRG